MVSIQGIAKLVLHLWSSRWNYWPNNKQECHRSILFSAETKKKKKAFVLDLFTPSPSNLYRHSVTHMHTFTHIHTLMEIKLSTRVKKHKHVHTWNLWNCIFVQLSTYLGCRFLKEIWTNLYQYITLFVNLSIYTNNIVPKFLYCLTWVTCIHEFPIHVVLLKMLPHIISQTVWCHYMCTWLCSDLHFALLKKNKSPNRAENGG